MILYLAEDVARYPEVPASVMDSFSIYRFPPVSQQKDILKYRLPFL